MLQLTTVTLFNYNAFFLNSSFTELCQSVLALLAMHKIKTTGQHCYFIKIKSRHFPMKNPGLNVL